MKRNTLRTTILCVCCLALLLSIVALLSGIVGLSKAYASEAPNPEIVETVEEEKTVDQITEESNNKIAGWINTIIGGLGIGLDTLLIAILSKKNNSSVAVTVNDETTQGKLNDLNNSYEDLKKIMYDMFQLSKGTFEVLVAVFSENKGLDTNIRDVIGKITISAKDVVKDFTDIFDADKHKAIKTTLNKIANIVVG